MLMKAERERRRLSQRQVASAVDVSTSHIQKIENGLRNPSIKLAEKLAEFFGKSVDRLFLRD